MPEREMKQPPLGLYIHWPFCVSKCPYCDFNSHVRNSVDHQRWKNALIKELNYIGQLTRGRRLQSVFFGGGTPSLMEPDTVQALLELTGNYWVNEDTEVTLEANPNSIEAAKFSAFKQAGINRVSIGIQSLDEKALKFLGRAHNREEALKALETAAKIFDNYSFDLIYARPQQTLKDWEEELSQAIPYIRDHVSLYQLTIENGTAFYTAHQRRDFELPKDGMAADLYTKTQEILGKIGIDRYEISNYARPGRECKHNLVYWRYRDYAGIGPGAHGRLSIENQKMATQCYRAPETWLAQVEDHGHGLQDKTVLTLKEQVLEAIIMGLRLKEGINLVRFKDIFGCDLINILEDGRVRSLIKEGYMELNEVELKTTIDGALRLNAVIEYLAEPLLSKVRLSSQ